MRGMEETYGMGAGASVRKGKTAKQVRRARKAIDAAKKTGSSKPVTKPATKPAASKTYGQSSKSYSVGKAPMKYRQTSAGKPKNYRRSQ
jgi:hypothetical protein